MLTHACGATRLFLLLTLALARPAFASSTHDARVWLEPTILEQAQALGFSLDADTTVLISQDWASADRAELPSSPSVYVEFSFTLPSSLRALGPDMKLLEGKPASGGKALLGYAVRVPIHQARSITKISLISAKGSVLAVPVQIAFEREAPFISFDPACAALGIEPRLEGAHSAIAFIRCTQKGAQTHVKLWSWTDSRWSAADPASACSAGSRSNVVSCSFAGIARAKLRLLKDTDPASAPLATIAFEPKTAIYRSWSLNAGLGPTWSSYLETAKGLPDIRVSQLGLTAKVQGQMTLFPRIDAALSVFGTVTSLSNSPATLPSARWLGVNLRGGYRLPLDSAARTSLFIMPGFYAWSMFVANDQYGVQNLNGPQLVLSLSHALDARISDFAEFRGFGAYAKIAIIDRGFGISNLSDHELAFGGNLIAKIRALPRPLVFGLDLSSLAFGSGDFSMNLSTFSLSIGCSVL